MKGTDRHETAKIDPVVGARRFEELSHAIRRHTEFASVPRRVHLDEARDLLPCFQGPSRDFLGKGLGIDRVDHVEAGRLLRFVRLEMADEVPADRQIGRLRDLLQRFLHFVFAEVDLAGGRSGAHVLGRKRFRDGDERDGGGIASGPAGCARDAIAHAGQPGPECRGVDHYFFGSDPRMFFTVAAFGPVGAIFRYVSNSVAAPARLPSFTSAIPSW